jgi:hypothetical protein
LCIYSKDRIATLLHGTDKGLLPADLFHGPGLPKKEQEVAHLTKCTCERCTGIAVESLYEEQPDADRRAKIINHAVEDAMRKPILEIEEQPITLSAPTRDEWEEWVENMPSHNMFTRMQWEEKMKQWYLTMPGVPK